MASTMLIIKVAVSAVLAGLLLRRLYLRRDVASVLLLAGLLLTPFLSVMTRIVLTREMGPSEVAARQDSLKTIQYGWEALGFALAAAGFYLIDRVRSTDRRG